MHPQVTYNNLNNPSQYKNTESSIHLWFSPNQNQLFRRVVDKPCINICRTKDLYVMSHFVTFLKLYLDTILNILNSSIYNKIIVASTNLFTNAIHFPKIHKILPYTFNQKHQVKHFIRFMKFYNSNHTKVLPNAQ